ncbi:MAG: hypothetical protein JNK75_04390 [Betaproteobacteria bacterium]|nr:hypothetical protein [Betaproteobacteria bacterium]
MSPGLLIGWIVTGFGAVAGAAILGAYFMPDLMPKVLALWIVFPICIGVGLFTAMMFAHKAGAAPLMRITGHYLAILGVVAGALALAALVNLWSTPYPTGPLWFLLVIAMPAGLLLYNSGKLVMEAGQRE